MLKGAVAWADTPALHPGVWHRHAARRKVSVLFWDASLQEEEMHLLNQTILGVVILFLLAMLVIVKQMATGSILA